MGQKKKKRKVNKLRKYFLSIMLVSILLIGFVWFIVMYNNLSSINAGYQDEIDSLEGKLDGLKRELTLKKAQVNYYKSDEYIEKIARDEAGLVMPNELVFIQTN